MTHHAAEFGISFDNLSYDWSKVIKRSRDVSGRLAGGIEFLFKKNKVDYVKGFGAVTADGNVEVNLVSSPAFLSMAPRSSHQKKPWFYPSSLKK